MDEAGGRVFLLDALDLVTSYLYSRSVKLEEKSIGVTATTDRPDDTMHFLDELEARHAIACGIRLKKVVASVEQRASSSRFLDLAESKGGIRGRIDIPRYVASRVQRRSLPRVYPVLISDETPETPENALVVHALRALSHQLGRSPFRRDTAEGQESISIYSWARARLRHWPWAAVRRVDSIERLGRETIQRIRKRQTGNELGYKALLDWVAEWQVDLGQLGSGGIVRVTEGLLAFPVGRFFWDKVFEIWCLREIAKSLVRCGGTLVDRPRTLDERGKGPIFQLVYGAGEVSIWFQQQSPLGTPQWRYLGSNRPLTGIPDIVVTRPNAPPLVVDAKFRNVATETTRPEETYKMLGYAENFRVSLAEVGFQGLLLFVGLTSAQTRLAGPNQGSLTFITVDSALKEQKATQDAIDGVVQQWLKLQV